MLLIFCGLYAILAYVTFVAVLHRFAVTNQANAKYAAKAVVYAAFWPIYWPAVHGMENGMRDLAKTIVAGPAVAFTSFIEVVLDIFRFLIAQFTAFFFIAVGAAFDILRFLVHQILVTVQTILDISAVTMRRLENLLNEAAPVYFIIGLLIVPALYLHANWGSCAGFLGCTGLLLKAFLWSTAWPVYLALFFGLIT